MGFFVFFPYDLRLRIRYAPCALRYAVRGLWLEERTPEELSGEGDKDKISLV
jgi:hypothetical protein